MAAGIVVVVAVVVVTARFWAVHQSTSDWVLWPKEVPSKVQFSGRDFDCRSTPSPSTQSLDGLTMQGKTAGGADIYAAARPAGRDVVASILVKAHGGTFTCRLMGGP
ncbi:hypothetical protein LK10_06390 [Sinomonas humi]|uniref:Uncharacterized protein n=1 Tax=Sinomonas humi TaxID=1338436 RepID=A0A0B2AKL3_9MICC|nr:hypothetical protein LK10_06390 [Sinomonas humi]